jgi:hypothetical protein
MKEQDIGELLDAVTWGRRIIEVKDNNGEMKTFVFRPLTLEEKNIGNYIHKHFMDTSTLMTRDELKKHAIHAGMWRVHYDSDLESLRKELIVITEERSLEEKTKMLDSKGRKKRLRPTSRFKKLNTKAFHISESIGLLEKIYTEHIELPSVEYAAECERGNYFLKCATLSFPEMNQVWNTLDDLNREQDTGLVVRLLRTYYNESIADEASIRRIARSGFWRCKWMASKKNRGVRTLFDREMFDLTLDQFRLVYWSQVYDSAFESMEAPSDDVIEDDKLFDRWLEEQHKKREQERKKSEFDKKLNRLDKKSGANEVGFNVMGEYCQECTCGILEEAESRGHDKRGHIHPPSCSYGVFLYYDEKTKSEKVEEIQSTNPDRVRKLLASEQKHLASVGVDGMEEQRLRGDKARSALGLDTKYYGPGEFTKDKKGRARPS